MRIYIRIQLVYCLYLACIMRKKPQQARSKRAVTDLIEATAKVIAERGLEQTTTNHIAKRAGVSVGSLYQYFADKDELVKAVMLELSREIMVAVDATLANLMEEDTSAVVHGLLTAALDAMEKKPQLYLELTRRWGQQRSLAGVNALEEHMMEACRRYILRHYKRLQVENLPAVLFVIINATLFTVMRHLSLPNPAISRQELIEELSTMISAYLEGTGSELTRG